MSAEGRKHETVEMFVLEAYEANVVLKLYEAASTPAVDVLTIKRFMSNRKPSDYSRPAHSRPQEHRRTVNTDRELWLQDAELAQGWALRVVENAVNRKIEKDVYPTLLGEPGSYEPGWGFKSLLGATWLQMRRFMLNEKNLCPVCNLVFYKSRRDKTYCSELCGDRARARRNYHEGHGASSKQARKAKRYRRES